MNDHLTNAYNLCRTIALSHYENFPVGSILLPSEQRPHVFAIYAFARIADDIADHPGLKASEKIEQLAAFKATFDRRENYFNQRDHLLCLAVNHSIETMKLSRQYFYDLLDAFKQDIEKNEYRTLNELTDYASRSANPVGRLMLELFELNSDENNRLSDQFCSGLQYINFWQDLSIDKQMKRFYVPYDLMQKHGYELNDFYFDVPDDRHSQLINELLDWTETQFKEGKQLIDKISGRFKYELQLIWWGGNAVLQECRRMQSQLLLKRPALSAPLIMRHLLD
ncbi:MAG: squalene synthase HpnC [Calditrichaeota bacterium]|nr:squalene synthase HpnC [Calditrichota bacterium]